jgi:hypothetical protein
MLERQVKWKLKGNLRLYDKEPERRVELEAMFGISEELGEGELVNEKILE